MSMDFFDRLQKSPEELVIIRESGSIQGCPLG